jgi:multidrug efflux pump subunit AcrB
LVPGSFVPPEDQGYLFGFVTAQRRRHAGTHRPSPPSSCARCVMSEDIENIFFINGVDFITGNNRPSVATTFIIFKPWDQRTASPRGNGRQVHGHRHEPARRHGLVFNPPPIQGLGTAGGFELYVQNRADGDPNASPP